MSASTPILHRRTAADLYHRIALVLLYPLAFVQDLSLEVLGEIIALARRATFMLEDSQIPS